MRLDYTTQCYLESCSKGEYNVVSYTLTGLGNQNVDSVAFLNEIVKEGVTC